MTTNTRGHLKRGRTTAETRHTKQDALDEREFELLLEGATTLEGYKQVEARAAVLLGGRCGFRPGEIAHLRADWIDWRNMMIEIPAHQRCEKGRDGGLCGYCRQHVQQAVEHNPGRSFEDLESEWWAPKTAASARSVPFEGDPRVEIALERLCDLGDGWQRSRQVVNRRVTAAAEAAPGLDADDVYPHALRSTCATMLAAKGLSTLPLMSMMGWEQLSTAEKYISRSSANTRRAVRSIHSQ